MPGFFENVIKDNTALLHDKHAFRDDESIMFIGSTTQPYSILTALSFKVGRKPKDLFAHLRRIIYCYELALSEQLYAALLDLLIVLKGRGQSLSRRLIQGSYSHLDSRQLAALRQAIYTPEQASGNCYSLFSKGLIGSPDLLEIAQQTSEQVDFLTLANDFIEYSQLEEAMQTLEQGLTVAPDRQDMQLALLELYQSTRSRDRFALFYQSLAATTENLAADWQLLADHFDGNRL